MSIGKNINDFGREVKVSIGGSNMVDAIFDGITKPPQTVNCKCSIVTVYPNPPHKHRDLIIA